jgi:microcystin-dependent protein
MKNQFLLLALLITSLSAPSSSAAEPPHLVPFQGHLARPSASDPTRFEPVPSGRYDILFTLYAAPVGGESKVWGPERHAQVTVVNGLVNALLGSVLGFEDTLATQPNFFRRPLYVGITIDADGNPNTADLELVPRQVLLPAVQALNANTLDGADWRTFFIGTDADATFTPGVTKARDADMLDGYDWNDVFTGGNPTSGTLLVSRLADQSITSQKIASASIVGDRIAPNTITEANLSLSLKTNSIIPPGSISAFAGINTPLGWLPCDGRIVSAADYPALFNALGTAWGEGDPLEPNDFHLPDLRGMFLRGVNDTKTGGFIDPEAESRTAQAAGGNTGNAVGSVQTDQFRSHTHTRPHTRTPFWNQDANYDAGEGLRRASGESLYPTGPAGGTETRPVNAYVHFIIKI